MALEGGYPQLERIVPPPPRSRRRPPPPGVRGGPAAAPGAAGGIPAEPVGPDARCGSTPDPVGHYLGGWHGAFPAGGPIVSLTPEPSGVEPSLMGVAP